MATSQRLSRGFHRLALFLAAVPLLVGGWFAVLTAKDEARIALYKHQQLVCAHEHIAQAPAAHPPKGLLSDEDVGFPLSLKGVGCSGNENETVTYEEARNPPGFNWFATFTSTLMPSMAITLALSLAVYGIVRTIGWVIGGFAAS